MEWEQSFTLEAAVAADRLAATNGDMASALFRVQLAARFDSMEVSGPGQVTFNGFQLEGNVLWGTFQEMLRKLNPDAKQKIANLTDHLEVILGRSVKKSEQKDMRILLKKEQQGEEGETVMITGGRYFDVVLPSLTIDVRNKLKMKKEKIKSDMDAEATGIKRVVDINGEGDEIIVDIPFKFE